MRESFCRSIDRTQCAKPGLSSCGYKVQFLKAGCFKLDITLSLKIFEQKNFTRIIFALEIKSKY